MSKVVGFVPTMGALHEGHLSLIREAKRQCDEVVVSILVNPLQFAPHEDFNAYPRMRERDSALCLEAGADRVFCPEVSQIYPGGFQTRVIGGELTQKYCGVTRPLLFNGALTVVNILFNIVKPQKAFFGEKDFQQLFLMKQMVKDFQIPVEIVGIPIVREDSGLALSSRNAYLNESQKAEAACLFRAILAVQEAAQCGERSVQTLIDLARSKISLEIDYLSLVDVNTLAECQEKLDGPARLLMAAYVGQPKVRLIDNGAVLSSPAHGPG
ncbi:MAG: pantoate--beta-alanine ligase [Myxococcota bacterium]